MRILLVSPGFHGYWRSIRDALAARGHQVTVHVYDDFEGVGAKLRNKLGYELPGRLGSPRGAERMSRDLTTRALSALRAARPDALVVVKGDVLAPDFWAEVDRRGLPRALWLYDELRRMSYDADRLRAIGPVASYSPLDVEALRAAGVDVRYLPLAFDPGLTPATPSTPSSEVVFVGARYPRREETLRMLAAAGVRVRAYGRQWSGHPVDRLRTWDLRRPGVPAGRDLDRVAAYAVMADAAATLNIHGDQDGFTMRTFEAAGVGAVQLIDRTDVADLYEPGVELAAYTTPEELVELCRRAVTDVTWVEGLRRAGRERTLAEHTFAARAAVLEAML